ncbi:hypothetical protein D8674_024574 [Pyrus ussuriensis x Pyrus communis]|uniref:Uncharacterized protein n=1 Tax=Pyrus ussuriensis x Pyrus communis TaxID=2448454 RepID=A0A5N5H8D4_9ROSA|nr:hypothetical protein D8674_024574 [Pyrus ussuriensis x Pyrus communis]
MVSRVSVDNGLRINVLIMDVAEKMGILDNINKGKTTIHTFNGALVRSVRTVKFAFQAEPYNHLLPSATLLQKEVKEIKGYQSAVGCYNVKRMKLIQKGEQSSSTFMDKST